jgi:hypothetical protein
MKRIRVIVNLIASWQLLLALALLFGEIVRIQNMSWGSPPAPPSFGIHYFQGLDRIYWQWIDTYFIAYIAISLVSCVGVFFKKEWGRKVSMLSFIMTLVLMGIWNVYMISYNINYDTFNFFDAIIAPIFVVMVLGIPSVLSIIYFNKPHVKEYLKKRYK